MQKYLTWTLVLTSRLRASNCVYYSVHYTKRVYLFALGFWMRTYIKKFFKLFIQDKVRWWVRLLGWFTVLQLARRNRKIENRKQKIEKGAWKDKENNFASGAKYLSPTRKHGSFHILFQDLVENRELVFRYHRMAPNRFEYLWSLVKDHIAKKERNFQKPKSARERLSLTLHFLITGESQQSISFPYLTGSTSVEHYLKNKWDDF